MDSSSTKKAGDEDVNAVSHELRAEIFLINLQVCAIPQANLHSKNFFGQQISQGAQIRNLMPLVDYCK